MSDFNNSFFEENGGNGGQDPNGFQNWNDNQNMNPEPNKNKKKNKKHSTGRKWAGVVAAALVFGLVAGTTTYAVNYTANKVNGTTTEASADTDSTSETSSAKNTSESAKLASTETSNTGERTATTDGDSTDSSTSVETVAKNAMPAMVTISTMSVQEMQSFFGGSQEYQVEGAGTGVILEINDDEVLIATNNHVITGADTVSVGFIDESVASAEIKGADTNTDLAVVAVKTSDLSDSTKQQIKAIALGDSDNLALGQQVVAIGNALGYGQSVTSGYVSALNRSLELSDGTNTYKSTGLIQTDAAINSGNSGGALLNMKGELVGINEAKSSSTSDGATVDNMGFAIPISKAQPILQKLMSQETKTKLSDEKRGYLGVNVTDVTSDYAQMYNMPEGVGVTNVADGSAAANAGIQKGDIITAIGGETVSTSQALTEQLQYYAAGDQVEITLQRADSNGTYSKKTVTVTLESQSEAQAQTQSSQNQNAEQNPDSAQSSSEDAGQNSDDSLYDLFQRMMP